MWVYLSLGFAAVHRIATTVQLCTTYITVVRVYYFLQQYLYFEISTIHDAHVREGGGFRYRQSMILDANRCLVLERERRSLDWRQRMRAKEVTHELRMVRAIHVAGVPFTLHFFS